MAVEQSDGGGDGSRTMSERIDITLACDSNRPVHREKRAGLSWPHVGWHYDAREVVTALENDDERGVARLTRRRFVEISNDARELEGQILRLESWKILNLQPSLA